MYLNRLLVFLYVALTIVCFLLLLTLSGIHISNWTGWLAVLAWILFCFSSAWLFTDLRLCFSHIRKPIRREEERLNSAFATVCKNAGYRKTVRLLVIESDEWNACAIGLRTIAVSKAMLEALCPNELEGVIAHELGHLISYDTIVASAYMQARLLTYGPGIIFSRIAGILLAGTIRKRMVFMVLLVILLYFLHLLIAGIALALFVLIFAILNRIFRFFDLLLSRMTEFRQDALAHRLGFGKDLRDVLEKLAQKREQPVRPYFIIFYSTHPIIYNRIRRLEQLAHAEDQR